MKNGLRYFYYFYGYLKHRIYITFFLSFFVGLLDGIGLALFIPLLKLVAKDEASEAEPDFITRFVVDSLEITPNLINILLLILVFFSLKGLAKLLEGFTRVKYQQLFMRKIRISNIDLLDTLDFKTFVKADVGRIQNSFSGEVQRVNTAFRFYFKSFQYGVLVLVYVGMAFTADPRFSFMVAMGGVLTNFIFKFLYRRTKFFSNKLTSKNHDFQGLLIQKVAFFEYLKTTGFHLKYSRKLKENITRLENLQSRIGVIDAILGALREPVIILVVITAIYFQVKFFNEDLGLIILSLLLLYRALTFLMAMQEQWNFFLGASGSLENMEKFTQELETAKESNGFQKFTGFKEKLSLRNLDFGYEDSKVLKNINLEIYKNETIAFVGESGSGKTTLLNIISGLLKPTKGSFKIDGQSLRDLELGSFRKYIGYIPQDSTIFNDTVFNNVTFWDERNQGNKKRFFRALKEAAIFDFVKQLPEEEETKLGSNGINLSGGQKQRISIARELYKQVDFLFMDEATSALDSETEAVIQQNIENLKGKFTIIIIAHRLATVKNTDRIVLLENGRIGAEGSYHELLKTSSRFQQMVRSQNL